MTSQRIGVVGAGMMGSEIALVFAIAGFDVRLNDTVPARLDAAMKGLAVLLEKGVARGQWPAATASTALARIHPTPQLADFADRDFVIEAVSEDEAVKGEVFRQLDGICGETCVIATNTSSFSITALSAHLSSRRRRRFLGTHFFSPVSRMALVEIVAGIDTAPQIVEAAISLCAAAGKTAVPVKDVVGFAVNRLLHAFLIEAIRLIEEGVASPADIDTACRLGLGHPIGPFALMDAVNNALVLQVQEVMAAAYGDRFRPPPLLKHMVKAGYHGRRSGRGWLVDAETRA